MMREAGYEETEARKVLARVVKDEVCGKSGREVW